jgi:hypothetical protein
MHTDKLFSISISPTTTAIVAMAVIVFGLVWSFQRCKKD